MLVTFDSCVVFGLVNGEKSEEFDAAVQLLKLASAGQIEIQLTTAFDRDLCRNSDAVRHSANLVWLSDAPVLLDRAGGVLRLDASPLGCADELASELDRAREGVLRQILKPSGKDPSKANSDLDHLLAHQRSGADAFVTTDRKTILRYANQLLELGIRVLCPEDTLTAFMATG